MPTEFPGMGKARSHIAPHTTMTGGPSPSRSKAIGVPSLEVTLSICSVPSLVRRVTTVWCQHTGIVLNYSLLGSSAHAPGLPRGGDTSWPQFEPGSDNKEGPEGQASEREGVIEGNQERR